MEDDLQIRFAAEDRELEGAVLFGLDFLFRMQQPAGSYGIYRYEQEYPDGEALDTECSTGVALPNENCTRMVMFAMGVGKGSGIFRQRDDIQYTAAFRHQ